MTESELREIIAYIEATQSAIDDMEVAKGKPLLESDFANGAGFVTVKLKQYLQSRLFEETEWISIKEASVLKHVSVQSIRDILRSDSRRNEIFPSAKLIGSKQRGEWKLYRKQVEEWQPRNYKKSQG